jgi:hypothetical protein
VPDESYTDKKDVVGIQLGNLNLVMCLCPWRCFDLASPSGAYLDAKTRERGMPWHGKPANKCPENNSIAVILQCRPWLLVVHCHAPWQQRRERYNGDETQGLPWSAMTKLHNKRRAQAKANASKTINRVVDDTMTMMIDDDDNDDNDDARRVS